MSNYKKKKQSYNDLKYSHLLNNIAMSNKITLAKLMLKLLKKKTDHR